MTQNFFLSILKPLAPFFEDPTCNEVRINPNGTIYVEHLGRVSQAAGLTLSPSLLKFAVLSLAGSVNHPLGDRYPRLDIRLDSGARVAILAPPVVPSGYAITIRRFPQGFTLMKFVENGTITPAQMFVLRQLIHDRKNLLISGGTGAGKTSLARVLLNLIPHPGDRLILIEQPAELDLAFSDCRDLVPIEVRDETPNAPAFTATDALKAALRHSPARIILGELRGGEAAAFLEALNTGHSGSLTTLHANSASNALTRLVTLVRRGDPNVARDVVIDSIAEAIHFVCHLQKIEDRRVLTEIVSVTGTDPGHTRILTTPYPPKGETCPSQFLPSSLAK